MKIAHALNRALVLVLLVSFAVAQEPADAISAFKPPDALDVRVRRDLLVGSWYGDQPTKAGGRRQWIMHRAKDGTFQVTFRTAEPKQDVMQQTEFGDWGVSANLLVTVTRGYIQEDGRREGVGGDGTYFWDVYEIQDVSEGAFKYRSVDTEDVYRVKRVADDFSFPLAPSQPPEPPTPNGRGSPGVPVFRSVSSWTVTHIGPNGYSSTEFAAINKNLEIAIRSNYPDRKIECFLVPRSFGYDVVILSEHALVEADEAKIHSLAVSARSTIEEARHPR